MEAPLAFDFAFERLGQIGIKNRNRI